METIISISDQEELRKVVRLTMYIRFPIKDTPQELANGDTFTMSIFGGEGVRLQGKHWDASKNTCTLMCFGRRELLVRLSKMGRMVPDTNGESFELQPQVWW